VFQLLSAMYRLMAFFQFGDGFEHAVRDAPSHDDGEEAFDRIQPGRGGGREVEDPSRVVGHLAMLARSVIVTKIFACVARSATGQVRDCVGLIREEPL